MALDSSPEVDVLLWRKGARTHRKNRADPESRGLTSVQLRVSSAELGGVV